MKTIEEKAKAYDKAIKIAKDSLYDPDFPGLIRADVVFPELKESEDERIRKELIAEVKEQIDYIPAQDCRDKEEEETLKQLYKRLAWLEKQGEKSVDKLQVSGELYEHIRNTCACIDDALSSETLADTKDYLSMAKHSAQSAFDMIEKQDSQNLDNSAKTCKDEQQPTNKVEQEFNVGDWIVKNDGNDCFSDGSYVLQIEGVYDEGYTLSNNNFLREPFFQTYRLWTIQDAKEGDVLYCKSSNIEYIVMSKGVNEHGNIDSYFRYNSLDGYGFGVDIPSVLSTRQDNITPATKEQRDLLFQKMREAGYEWDAEKKELTKIEEKSIEKPTKGNYYTCIKDYEFCEHDDMTFEMGKIYKCEEDGTITADNGGLWPFRDITGFFRLSTHEEISSHIKKSVEWSEEDNAMLDNIVAWIEGKWGTLGGKVGGKEAYISFLKSIRDRVQPQLKQEWSEKDSMYIKILQTMIAAYAKDDKDRKELVRWLDVHCNAYPIPRQLFKAWKPSDEQMKALDAVVVDAKYKNDISTSGYEPYTHLYTLLRDLKKLREE